MAEEKTQILERIEEFLKSDDIEMKTLGLRIAQEEFTEEEFKYMCSTIVWPYKVIRDIEGEYRIERWDDTYIVDLWATKQRIDSPLIGMKEFGDGIIFEDTNEFKWEIPLPAEDFRIK